MNCSHMYAAPRLKTEEREKYIHNLQKNHGLQLEKMFAWLAAHRFAEYWEANPFLDVTSTVANVYSLGIYTGSRSRPYDAQGQEVAAFVLDCLQHSEYIHFDGVDFYPVMDVLLFLLSEFMDENEDFSERFPSINNDCSAADFSMQWITFNLRFHFHQMRKN